MDAPPPEMDGPCARWALRRLCASFIAKAVITFNIETLRTRIHERGFRWKRPRLRANGQDPGSFEKQLLIELEHASNPTAIPEQAIHFCYGDASDQRLVGALRGMWSRRGQQVPIETPASQLTLDLLRMPLSRYGFVLVAGIL